MIEENNKKLPEIKLAFSHALEDEIKNRRDKITNELSNLNNNIKKDLRKGVLGADFLICCEK